MTTCAWRTTFRIQIVGDLFSPHGALAKLLRRRRTLVVSTPTVWSLYGERMAELARTVRADAPSFVIDADERSKSIENVARICEACQNAGLGRTDALLALGGGVCSDLVTVAAALVRRGVALVRVPTTLVGQIDAGVGIKGGVNFRGAKSYLGVFEPPETTLVDPAFLRTAPRETTLDGIAEAVKIAVIRDTWLFALLEKRAGTLDFTTPHDAAPIRALVRRAIAGMREELAPNLFEDRSLRRAVDFGHTFGPLLETRTNHAITHGVSVAIDMALSASIALTLGKTTRSVFERICNVLRGWSLPVWSELLTPESCDEALRSAASHRGGTPNLVIPIRIGTCQFVTDRRTLGHAVLDESLRRLADVAAPARGAAAAAPEPLRGPSPVAPRRGAPPS